MDFDFTHGAAGLPPRGARLARRERARRSQGPRLRRLARRPREVVSGCALAARAPRGRLRGHGLAAPSTAGAAPRSWSRSSSTRRCRGRRRRSRSTAAACRMLGPTLMKHGTPAQRERLLPSILTAEEIWCQGFSEPNAGQRPRQSPDARGAGRRPLRRERSEGVDQHGATWPTGASSWCAPIPTAAKHKGITFLLVDMKTPGITIRPLRQITGEAEFNEVVPRERARARQPTWSARSTRAGAWRITTLAYERDVLTMIRHISLRTALRPAGRARPAHQAKAAPRRGPGRPPEDRRAVDRRAGASSSTATAASPRSCAAAARARGLDVQALLEPARPGAGPGRHARSSAPTRRSRRASEWAPDEGQWQFYALLARGSGIRAGTTEILAQHPGRARARPAQGLTGLAPGAAP